MQTSDALAYLHSLVPPIVHRDVKPANILIKHRSSGRDDVIVKFGDFGLLREGDTLETVCGIWTYTAPEVHKADYTAFVDVWSLGVVLVELLGLLPSTEGWTQNVNWCLFLYETVQKATCASQDLLSFVLNSMLCLKPENRENAVYCYKRALVLLENRGPDRRDADRSTSGWLHNRSQNTAPPETKSNGSTSTVSTVVLARDPPESKPKEESLLDAKVRKALVDALYDMMYPEGEEWRRVSQSRRTPEGDSGVGKRAKRKRND